MAELLKSQQAGNEPSDAKWLRKDAGKIKKKYPTDKFPGHSAWTEYPWKLHRIEGKSGKQAKFELYNLSQDAKEKKNLSATEPERVKTMTMELEIWLKSVTRSLNGKDY